jgi:DNA modification methylase
VTLAIDPFLGLGSSAVAAARLGLDFIGIEIDQYYLDEAIARVKNEVAGKKRKARVTRPQKRKKPGTLKEPGLF